MAWHYIQTELSKEQIVKINLLKIELEVSLQV